MASEHRSGNPGIVVYEKLGLKLLRKVWLNQNLIWAFALMTAGVLMLFLA